ncbi:espin-like protein [Alosa sapidissima]|uniref:espin-like protein n=1 Tax=Alosa sapidissima TaxID=34773 RepID=UPI001C0942AE|nr:espin-like protein [Alosa sapidissima]
MEGNKQPVKEVPPQPRSPPPPASVPMTMPLPLPSLDVTMLAPLSISTSAITTATARTAAASLQHMHLASTVATSFNMPKAPDEDSDALPLTHISEEDSNVPPHIRALRSLRHAGITAVFTGQTKAENALLLCPAEGAVLVDVDTLVPTHDAEGRPIPEWKRQVMVRRLHARLSEEHQQHKDPGWRFSQVHDALLGPFGELLTEDDLMFLERQIENASEQHRFHAYEAELTRLAERLQAILPAPVINITVNTQPQQLSPGNEGTLSLPAWYSRIYGIVRSLNHLLGILTEHSISEGLGDDPNARLPLVLTPSSLPLLPLRQPVGGRSRRERVQTEIEQAGVSVRLLRSNFEGQTGLAHPLTGRLHNPEALRLNTVTTAADKPLPLSVPTESDGHRAETEYAPNTPHLRVNPTSGPRVTSDPGPNVTLHPNLGRNSSTPISHRCSPIMDSGSLRKERIVVLFLSHWKRSAYAISLRAKLTLGIHEPGNSPALQGAIDPTSIELQLHSPAPDNPLRDISPHHCLPVDTQLSPNLQHMTLPPQTQTSYNSVHQSLASDPKAGTNSVYQSLPACTKASHNFKQLSQVGDTPPCSGAMHRVCRQMMFVHKMISTWKRTGSSSRALVRQGSGASPPRRLTYSPEQFLSQADGGAVPYSRLTLDLFMLGYLRLLECKLPADERKMRHLLCFEVFDHVGRYPWETVRGFHAAVLREIEEGRRSWGDGFDDIKARFFGGGEEARRRRSSGSGRHLVVPRLSVDGSALESCGVVAGEEEEACGFITRSFAFWKQQEAELFHLKQLT